VSQNSVTICGPQVRFTAAHHSIGTLTPFIDNSVGHTFWATVESTHFPSSSYQNMAWRPYLQKDIDLLEKVQKRATRLMINDRSLQARSQEFQGGGAVLSRHLFRGSTQPRIQLPTIPQIRAVGLHRGKDEVRSSPDSYLILI